MAIVITAATNWNFTITEQTLTTGSAFQHIRERTGTLLDADEIIGPSITNSIVSGPVSFSNSFLWETGRVATPISWTGPGPSPVSGPVFATFKVIDSNIDFLQQGQTLTQTKTVTVTNNGETGIVNLSLTVIGSNDAPQAFNNLSTINENTTTLTNRVIGNDFDPDHGGAAVADDVIGITAAGTGVLSVVSAFSTFLNTTDVSIQRVNFLNNALALKDSIKAQMGTAFQSLMTGQTAVITINYRIADQLGLADVAQFKITVLGVNDAQIFGTAGHDARLFGENDADTIFGLAGNDIIDARAGNDTVYGDLGIDTIRGGLGRDILFGQAGADRFIFGAVTESGLTATTRDYLADFVDGQDKIYLNGIDANAVLAGNQAFVLIAAMGTATSAVGTGRVGWYQVNVAGTANDRTFLRANNDADALIEMTIELKGLVNISAVNGTDIFF